MGRVRFVWALLEPVVEIARAKPTTAIIPVLILFFGVGDLMKIWSSYCLPSFRY